MLRKLIVVGVVGLSATAATAAPTIYTSETAFRAATTGTNFTTESFERVAAGSGNTLVFDNASFNCTNCAAAVSSAYPTDGRLSLGVNTGATQALQFGFFRSTDAVSFDLSDFGTLGAADLTLTVNGQSVKLLDQYRGANGNRLFLGFTDTSAFTAFTLTGGNSGDTAYFDRLRFGSTAGTPPPSAVPEPATWAMMIAGFGAIGGSLRRRKSGTLTFA